MRVFIENEQGSNKKNLFNEKTLEYKRTVEVSRAYPYPYGFLIGTTSGDGDNVDCFILTHQELKTGTIVEAEPVGMFEQIEDGQEDHKILAVLPGEMVEIDAEMQAIFREFIAYVFDHKPGKQITVGRFLGKNEAEKLITKTQDKPFI